MVAPLKRVAAYCRVSAVKDRTQDSLEAQISYFNTKLQQMPGCISAGVFIDNGISATSLKKRLGLRALLDKARSGEVDVILTKSISRLARNTVDLLNITREMKSIGVEIIFEKENISSLSASGEVMLTLLASFAQAESEQRSRDVSWAVKHSFKNGHPYSFNLYGYSRQNGQICIVEDEAKLIRRTYESYMKKISAETMAKEFAKEGLLWRDGTPIKAMSIRQILKNEKYKGCLLLQKHVTPALGKHTILNTGHEDSFWVEDSHPAIVSKELWDAVQEERERRCKLGAFANWSLNTSCFTSLMYCGACGATFRKHKTKNSADELVIYWHCMHRDKSVTHARAIREDELRTLATAVLELDTFDEGVFQAQVKSIQFDLDDTLTFHLTDGTTRTIHRPIKPQKSKRPTLSPAERSKRASERMKALWKDPEFRARHQERQAKRWADPENRERFSEWSKTKWKDPSFREKVCTGMKRRQKNG